MDEKFKSPWIFTHTLYQDWNGMRMAFELTLMERLFYWSTLIKAFGIVVNSRVGQ